MWCIACCPHFFCDARFAERISNELNKDLPCQGIISRDLLELELDALRRDHASIEKRRSLLSRPPDVEGKMSVLHARMYPGEKSACTRFNLTVLFCCLKKASINLDTAMFLARKHLAGQSNHFRLLATVPRSEGVEYDSTVAPSDRGVRMVRVGVLTNRMQRQKNAENASSSGLGYGCMIHRRAVRFSRLRLNIHGTAECALKQYKYFSY